MIKRLLLACVAMVISVHVWAEEGAFPNLKVSSVAVSADDIESIKRGAKFFSTTCMSCHTMVYLRYDKLAHDQGVIYDKMPINVKQWPNGIKPPDLSLEASVRGVDWIYTYLHSFYQDPSRPTGVNNLLVPGTAMPNILGPYQGDQILAKHVEPTILYHQLHWFDYLTLTRQGTMSPEEYDRLVTDIVNFLQYAAEPYQQTQHHIGYWVLGFLAILFVFMYLVKKEYWRDIYKPRSRDNKLP